MSDVYENEVSQQSILSKLKSMELGILAIMTAFVFLFGHVSAYFYYSSWGIDYFNNADSITPYIFTMSSFGVFVSTIVCALLFVFFIPFLGYLFEPLEPKHGDGLLVWVYNKSLYFLSFLTFCALLALLFIIIGILINYISSNATKESVRNKLYQPVNIYLSTGEKFFCVFNIGKLGSSTVFVSTQLQPLYISTSQISQMYNPMGIPPKKEFNEGKADVNNEFFEDEYKVWISEWSRRCSSDLVYNDYPDFDFVRDARAMRKKLNL